MAELIGRKELRDALYEADAVTMQGVKIINQFPALADRYGVSKKTMQNAIKGVTWKCVPYMPDPPKGE